MKCAFVTASVSRNAGGLFESVRSLAKGVFSLRHQVLVFGVQDEHTACDIETWQPVGVKTFPMFGPPRFSYSPGLNRALSEFSPDILHSHSLWNHTSIASNRWHRKTRRPYVVHPHGMLDLWALRNSQFQKILIDRFYERRHLKQAACIRALNESEAAAIRNYGLSNPICIIPNGIDLPTLTENTISAGENLAQSLKRSGHNILLYLGRIHPKKGLVNLLFAWKAVLNSRPKERGIWVLLIAGWDENNHEAELKRLARELALSWVDCRKNLDVNAVHTRNSASVFFLGPQFGEAKVACCLNCDAFILPSFSEGLPMTALEAWSYEKPIVLTPECNLPEAFAEEAGIRVAPTSDSIERGLQQLFDMTVSQRRNMGTSGLKLIRQKFTWPKLARDLCAVNDWILSGGSPPECVRV